MTPASVHLANYIDAHHVAVEFDMGTNLFVGVQPDKPQDCVTLYDIGGPSQNAKLAIEEVSVQLRGRNLDYTAGYEVMYSLKALFEGIETFTMGHMKYVGIWVDSGIMSLGRDEQDRYMFSLNFRIIREPDSANSGNRETQYI